ncbi:hypothetical protein P5G50_10555 [Leifsonia sp. F6_8S_P_1B]|uniref:Uncharacterized protein n=1 Tax=Leifsonia williamsii TaxID=3035919 RepID=A0ABT8KBS1_9MICO|nr:hypothetical protein [Leifsonia williamsii]MDN4614891.1 hypothetical protein [Leifsonia williamsii]
MITDPDVIAELRDVGWRRADPDREEPYDYRITGIRLAPGNVTLELAQRDGRSGSLYIGLPSSDAPKPWLYLPPEDARDWVAQLLISLDEEAFTAGFDGVIRLS